MKENKLKIITITLAIILVTMISFFGVYTQQKNKMVFSTKDFQYGMDIDSAVVYTLAVKDDSTDDVENYNKVKSILESRIRDINKNITQQYENNPSIETTKIQSQDYQVNVNEEDGQIVVTLPANDDAYYISSLFTQNGKFEVADAQTDEVLLDKSDVASSNLQTYTYSGYTAVSFRIEFNNQGKEKIQTIKENYGENATSQETTENTTEETTEDTTTEATEKKLALKINGEEVYSAELDEFITNDAIVLTIGEATNEKDTLKTTLAQGQTLIAVLSNDEMPIEYEIKSSITVAPTEKEDVTGLILIFSAFFALIMSVFFIIRYKLKGLIASASLIGFISCMLLLIRYFNVTISLEGIVSLFITIIINTVLLDTLLKNIIKEENNKKVELKHVINNTIKNMAFKVIPLFILAVVFAFTNKTPASSFGMVMFWGLTLILLYNLAITKSLLKYNKSNAKK